VQTFFDVYLNGAPASEVTGLLALYPELKMGVTSAFPPASSN
jgi:hypothetical protein